MPNLGGPSLGWFACVVCVVFTLRCAFAFARKQPDIFLALLVYAGVWGVLIVYYSEPVDARNELLPALNGYLAAISGFLVFRRHLRRNDAESHRTFHREQLVAWLLLLLAIPKAVHTQFGKELLPGVNEADIQILVTLVLDTIGFLAMYKAIEVSQPSRHLTLALAAPIAIYWLANVGYALRWASYRVTLQVEPQMSAPITLMFAVLKIAAVLTFVPAVVAPYEPFRSLSWGGRIMHFLVHSAETD